jgi:hypothetical protein
LTSSLARGPRAGFGWCRRLVPRTTRSQPERNRLIESTAIKSQNRHTKEYRSEATDMIEHGATAPCYLGQIKIVIVVKLRLSLIAHSV